MSAGDVRVGDRILIEGTAIKVLPGVGVLVELFSKSDQYEAWVREDLVREVIVDSVWEEPADGTWLVVADEGDCGSVFRRDDAEGHNDPDRRYHRRWWDYAAGEWIDWPTACRRGANPNRRLREEATDGD